MPLLQARLEFTEVLVAVTVAGLGVGLDLGLETTGDGVCSLALASAAVGLAQFHHLAGCCDHALDFVEEVGA